MNRTNVRKNVFKICKSCKKNKKNYCKGVCKTCYRKQLVPQRWSRVSDCCLVCETSERPHARKGLCDRCSTTQPNSGVLCACGCGLETNLARGKPKKFLQGHWVRTQGEGSVFRKMLSENFSGKGNPQYGKFGKDHPSYGHKTKPEVRELRRKRLLKTLSEGKMGKTSIEVILSEILDELGLSHNPQELLYDKFTVDEYLPSEGIIIEAYGEYWHGDRRRFDRLNRWQMTNFKRDISRNKWLNDRGHRVLILWEKELKNDREWCKQEILSAIENKFLPQVQDSIQTKSGNSLSLHLDLPIV